MAKQSLRLALADVLKEFRSRSGLSQEQLGYKAGVHRTYVSQLERGIKSPTVDVLAALSAALGTEPHVIMRQAEDRAS